MQKIMGNKGITLVALVVTIVIMLILAGVTIGLVTGENGLFKMASQTVEKYKTAQTEEESTMQELVDELHRIIGKGKDDKTPGEITGEGTEAKPFLIESIEDLVVFSNNVNSGTTYENQVVKLAVNLDFQSEDSYVDYKTTTYGDINGTNGAEELKTELTTGTGFKTIGDLNKKFYGTFDGQNRTISNLYINVAKNYKGLFGYVGNKASIKNLTITDANINCEALYIGTLAGYVDGGTIENIKVINGVVKGNRCVGGIVGLSQTKTTIKNCTNSSDVTANGLLSTDNQYHSDVGGILGVCSNGTIMNCYNKGQINSLKGSAIGGIMGVVNGVSIIDSCFNEGKIGDLIKKDNFVAIGGIAGDLQNSKVFKCYNVGEISGVSSVCGIVGGSGWNSTVYIENCYNMGVVTAIQGNVAGITYISPTTTGSEIKNCYNTGIVNATVAINSNIRKYCRDRK